MLAALISTLMYPYNAHSCPKLSLPRVLTGGHFELRKQNDPFCLPQSSIVLKVCQHFRVNFLVFSDAIEGKLVFISITTSALEVHRCLIQVYEAWASRSSYRLGWVMACVTSCEGDQKIVGNGHIRSLVPFCLCSRFSVQRCRNIRENWVLWLDPLGEPLVIALGIGQCSHLCVAGFIASWWHLKFSGTGGFNWQCHCENCRGDYVKNIVTCWFWPL